MALLDADPLGHLDDRDRDGPPEDLGHLALVVRREVDHDDERARVRRGEPAEERIEGLEPARRGAEADDDEGLVLCVGPVRRSDL